MGDPQSAEGGKAPGVPQPEPVEIGPDGPEITVPKSDKGHKHSYQTFRNLGEQSDTAASKFHERCAGCGHVKGATRE